MQNIKKKSRALMFFGCYLLIAGGVGYLSNPSKAITALYSGGLFGLLNIGCGFLLYRNNLWAHKIGTALVSLLVFTFSWRSSVGWIAVSNGVQAKLFASVLISSMLIAALVTLKVLLTTGRQPPLFEHPKDARQA